MLISFIRTIILYSLIVVAMRVMGKRQVGQLEPTELVIALMISDVAAIPMERTSIPLIQGVIPILTFIIAEAALSFINLKSRRFRRFLSGTPVVLIRNGKVFEEELVRLRMNLDDLMEELRISGNPDITDIEYAIFETNGSLSIIPKSENRTAIPMDFDLHPKYKGLPFLLVCDGKINWTALKAFEKDDKWLTKQLQAKGAKNIKDVLYASVDENGKFYMQKRGKR